MGAAYAVKKGDSKLSDIDPEYREEVKGLVDGMTLKQLKDFAATKHEGLPDRVEESGLSNAAHVNPNMNVPGMGAPALPGDPSGLNDFSSQTRGSGDLPDPPLRKKRKRRAVMTFEQFNALQR
jgi:hypothetical protein